MFDACLLCPRKQTSFRRGLDIRFSPEIKHGGGERRLACLDQEACVDALEIVPHMALPCSLNMVSAPEIFERSSAQLRVSGRVLDVGMAQPQLQPSSIVAGIGQEVPASVAQHMRVQVG